MILKHAELLAALRAVTQGKQCHFDVLNPCWTNRPTDIVGKHWGSGDACPHCNALGVIHKYASPLAAAPKIDIGSGG